MFVSASAALQYTWDGTTTRDPYCDESSSTTTDGVHGHHYGTTIPSGGVTANPSSDWNGYDVADTPGSVAWSLGTGNSTHSIGAVLYQTAPPPIELGPAKAPTADSAKATLGHSNALVAKSPTAAAAKAVLKGSVLLSAKSATAMSATAVFGAPIRLIASAPDVSGATRDTPEPASPARVSAARLLGPGGTARRVARARRVESAGRVRRRAWVRCTSRRRSAPPKRPRRRERKPSSAMVTPSRPKPPRRAQRERRCSNRARTGARASSASAATVDPAATAA